MATVLDPVSFIKLRVIPINQDDPAPTLAQVKVLERFAVILERALRQCLPWREREGDHAGGRRLIQATRRAMLSIRPHTLRAQFNDITWALAEWFEQKWKDYQRRNWRNEMAARDAGFGTWNAYHRWLKAQGTWE